MKRVPIKISLVISLLVVSHLILNGQQSKPFQTDERVVLFSDRSLYIAGENIYFSASLQSVSGGFQRESSRILYCELITPDGNKISSDKFLITNYAASGYLNIPNDIVTGIYFLRAYTRYMRNRGPLCYKYSLIKIVNAGRNEVRASENDTYLPGTYAVAGPGSKSDSIFHITTDKSQYSTRDTVNIELDCTPDVSSSLKGLSLSVVPEYSVLSDSAISPEYQQVVNKSFYPVETRGLSITGNISDSKTGNPIPDIRINLSIIGKGRDFMARQSDSAGRFFFSLPDLKGHRDLFLCTERLNNLNPKILVDNDFCTIPVHIATKAFALTDQERNTAFNLAINEQVASYFNTDTIADKDTSQPGDVPFYGKPSDILYIDNYVQLPTLEDYLNELPTLVKVRKRQGEKYFKVLGTQNGLTYADPLVLVDLVAIDDPSRVLAIPPASISRIEIVNNVYVKGDQTYGGVINIITKQKDFAGIDLPTSGIFIDYGFLQNENFHRHNYPLFPDYPDARNTLYWEPKLELKNQNSTKVSFATADTPGRYLIVLSGINLKGESFRQISLIEVKQRLIP